jgi:hypothetical protein
LIDLYAVFVLGKFPISLAKGNGNAGAEEKKKEYLNHSRFNKT